VYADLSPLVGVHGDLNETYPVGKVDDASIRLMKASRDSMYAAIEICKPGALFRDIGKAMSV
jgi:methionyl aminopeptidase